MIALLYWSLAALLTIGVAGIATWTYLNDLADGDPWPWWALPIMALLAVLIGLGWPAVLGLATWVYVARRRITARGAPPIPSPSSDALLLAWAKADAAYQVERSRVRHHLAHGPDWFDVPDADRRALRALYDETEAKGKVVHAAHAAVTARARELLAAEGKGLVA